MPVMYLNTNLQNKDIPADFELRLCQKVGEVLEKPMERITLTVRTGVRQMRAGSTAAMASLDIYSINVFDQDNNPKYTPPLLDFLKTELKVPETRVLLIYHDLKLHNVGQVLS